MKRRQFIQRTLLSGTAFGLWSSSSIPFSFNRALANNVQGKTLVKIFQRGGNDGLNTIVPYGEDNYYNLRPSIAIAAPNANGTASALDLDGFFGFNPAMNKLWEMYQDGLVACLPATHYPDANRSHFAAQKYIENAKSEASDTGWLNKHLSTNAAQTPLRALSVNGKLSQSLRGPLPVTNLTDFRNVEFGVGIKEESELVTRLKSVYQQLSVSNQNQALIKKFGSKLVDDISLLRQIKQNQRPPENGAIYPKSPFGRRLYLLASVIKANVGLEVANLDIGGWDTHANQGGVSGRQSNLLKDMSDSLHAFYQDLGTLQSQVTTIVGTEFGRTAKENGSFGTDHGNAASWFVIGGEVNGGLYGQWPTLNQGQLYRQRYLSMSTDYRDIYADVLSNFMGNQNLQDVLEGHTVSELGLFS